MKINELKEKRSSLQSAVKAIIDKAEIEKRSINETETTTLDALKKDIDALDADIKAIRDQRKAGGITPDQYGSTIREAISNGVQAQQAIKLSESRTLTVGGTGAGAVQSIGTRSGAPVNQIGIFSFPIERHSSTGVEIHIASYNVATADAVAEGANAPDASLTTVKRVIKPERVTSQQIISRELINSGGVNPEQDAYVQNLLDVAVESRVEKKIIDYIESDSYTSDGGTLPADFSYEAFLAKINNARHYNGFCNGIICTPEAFDVMSAVRKDPASGLFMVENTTINPSINGIPVLVTKNAGTGKKVYLGDFRNIAYGQWTKELFIDQYTRAGQGEVVVTVANNNGVVSKHQNLMQKLTIADPA